MPCCLNMMYCFLDIWLGPFDLTDIELSVSSSYPQGL
jgi:hypothetical protein